MEVIDAKTIPTNRLNDAYVAAARGREIAGLLTPGEIVAAWKRIAAAEGEKRRQAETQRQLAALNGPPPLVGAERTQMIAAVRTGAITAGRFNPAGDHALRLVRSVEGDKAKGDEPVDKEA